MFQVGDKVKIVDSDNKMDRWLETIGTEVTIEKVDHNHDKKYPYTLTWPGGPGAKNSSNWGDHELQLISNTNSMAKSLLQSFSALFVQEPHKSFRKAGIEGENGLPTDDGVKIILAWMLDNDKALAEKFKAEVVDAIVKEQDEAKKE